MLPIFSSRLFSEFGKPNRLGSAYSAFLALHPLFEASQGKTREQLGELLGLDPKGSYFREIVNLCHTLTTTGELQTSNMIAVNKTLVTLPEYFASIKTAGIDTIPFSSREELVTVCNHYANEKTKGLITELLKVTDVDDETVLVICSTIYFLSKWKTPFNSSHTYDRDFTKIDGSKVKVPLMFQNETYFRYFKNETLQYLEMSYQNEDFAMGILLPRISDDLDSVNTFDTFQKCTVSAKVTELKIYFPKFTHRVRQSLKEIVTKHGCGNLFHKADLTNLTPETDTRVTDIIHEAVVIVDETKTEASGATAVVVKLETCRPPRNIETFRADHSFGYVIFHRPSGTILFNGCFDA
jgi:serine protease inhibitor